MPLLVQAGHCCGVQITEDMSFCPQPLICCLVELSYSVSSLPLSFGVQVQGLAQQCDKPQGQEHKGQ